MQPKTIVSFVLAHEEPEFLPRWKKYYAQVGDIFVHDESPPHEWGEFIEWHIEVTHKLMDDFLTKYDVVVTSAVDEFLVPDSRNYADLYDYLCQFDGEYVTAQGYHVIDIRKSSINPRHLVGTNHGLYWLRDESFDKSLITTIPLRYVHGLHSLREKPNKVDIHLYLLHLHREDYERCLARHRSRRTWTLRPEHHWMLEGEKYDAWFYETETGRDKLIEPMPEWVTIP